jgi:heme/copper-type cytochrome/quinol oxidase subunit 2
VSRTRVHFGVVSNWRTNVARLGMWGSDWELAARWINVDPNPAYIVKRTGSRFWWIYDFPLSRGLPVLVNRFLITSDDPHFPYGQDVLPD